jgi:hypothetical protein
MLLFLMGVFSIVLLCSETTSGQPLSNATTPNPNATAANATVVNQTAQPSPNKLNLEAVPIYEEVAQNGSITIDLPLQNSQPLNANWTYTLESLPRNGSIQPIRIGAPIPNGIIRYEPAPNFVGVDYFTYKIHNETSSTNVGSITIKTYVTVPIISDPIRRIAISFAIAIASIVAITCAAAYIISKLRKSVEPIDSFKFWDIIRSNNMDPSLSVFQFFLWTIVLMFVLFSVYLIRIFGGVTEAIPGPPPLALLALTGITFVTPFGSSLISALRYPKADTVAEASPESRQKVRPPLGEMLREFGKPSLSRFQMFGWTWISIIIYLFVYGAELGRDYSNIVNLRIPEVFPLLVVLMGLSQVVFLGAKANVTSQIEITKVFPQKVTRGGHLSIFGLNFGDVRQDVWIGTRRIGSDDREHLLGWSDGRIDIKIPIDIPEPPGIGYEIMVAKGGSSKIAFEGGSPIRITIRSTANQ